MAQKLTIATYNVQFSLNPTQIRKDVLTMAQKGVSIFCLQEVVRYENQKFLLDILLEDLGPGWKAIYNLGREKKNLGMGNGILWNVQKIKLKNKQEIFLPKSRTYLPHEMIFSLIAGGIIVPFQRRTISGTFQIDEKYIRITNLHLDHNGGLKNRGKQLKYLVNVIKKETKVDCEIICGDFNSFDLLKRGEEYRQEKEIIGSDFHDISDNVAWTADLGNTKLKCGMFLNFFIKHIHIKRKLDFIWAKNMKRISCETLPVNTSDHRPLIAFLEF